MLFAVCRLISHLLQNLSEKEKIKTQENPRLTESVNLGFFEDVFYSTFDKSIA